MSSKRSRQTTSFAAGINGGILADLSFMNDVCSPIAKTGQNDDDSCGSESQSDEESSRVGDKENNFPNEIYPEQNLKDISAISCSVLSPVPTKPNFTRRIRRISARNRLCQDDDDSESDDDDDEPSSQEDDDEESSESSTPKPKRKTNRDDYSRLKQAALEKAKQRQDDASEGEDLGSDQYSSEMEFIDFEEDDDDEDEEDEKDDIEEYGTDNDDERRGEDSFFTDNSSEEEELEIDDDFDEDEEEPEWTRSRRNETTAKSNCSSKAKDETTSDDEAASPEADSSSNASPTMEKSDKSSVVSTPEHETNEGSSNEHSPPTKVAGPTNEQTRLQGEPMSPDSFAVQCFAAPSPASTSSPAPGEESSSPKITPNDSSPPGRTDDMPSPSPHSPPPDAGMKVDIKDCPEPKECLEATNTQMDATEKTTSTLHKGETAQVNDFPLPPTKDGSQETVPVESLMASLDLSNREPTEDVRSSPNSHKEATTDIGESPLLATTLPETETSFASENPNLHDETLDETFFLPNQPPDSLLYDITPERFANPTVDFGSYNDDPCDRLSGSIVSPVRPNGDFVARTCEPVSDNVNDVSQTSNAPRTKGETSFCNLAEATEGFAATDTQPSDSILADDYTTNAASAKPAAATNEDEDLETREIGVSDKLQGCNHEEKLDCTTTNEVGNDALTVESLARDEPDSSAGHSDGAVAVTNPVNQEKSNDKLHEGEVTAEPSPGKADYVTRHDDGTARDDDESEKDDDETEVDEEELENCTLTTSFCESVAETDERSVEDVVAVVIDDDDQSESDCSEALIAAVVIDEDNETAADLDETLVDDESESIFEQDSVAPLSSQRDVSTTASPESAKEGVTNDNLHEPPLVPSSPMLQESSSQHGSLKNPVNNNLQRPSSSRQFVKRGKWTLGPKIGQGSFGTVHMCMTDEGVLMAAKVIPTTDTSVISDIRREVELLSKLNHPNIVAYRGAQSNSKRSRLHIFQEWVPGGSVASMLTKFGAFTLPVARVYLKQVLTGLSYLHCQKILHRDIKGSNVLVNDLGIVKLADFGASKQLSENSQGMIMTMTMRGTPYFMAPECFEEKYGYESDIWSVGCLAIQMRIGLPPWKNLGITNPVMLYKHIEANPGPPSADLPTETQQDRDFAAMVARCFHRSPVERPNAQELEDDLFFFRRETIDDDQTGISSVLASPSGTKDGSFGWEHLMSPTTPPMSGKSKLKSRHRRSSSAGCLKSPLFLSPPIPENSVLKLSPARALRRVTSPAMASPQYVSKEWPAWARDVLKSDSKRPASQSSPAFAVDTTLSESMGSLAISEDSPMTVQGRNLFSDTKNSGYFSEISEESTLRGENLLEIGSSIKE
ncbi:activated protein kinase catalytic subunit alpha-1 [Seminavis robusta]|uniref:Activated protein kinase catalytic subunit alpha-1 n=1 Tax=Seminavis robusta TaxID=568900 RepID=A0A9N8ECQ9_9STRA|nr:activated protein kinase catalytic subunit alpha-1 [Seminavis robusta]|eukprot:Sro807_g205330.1 activated protein kinase catalytic subunit alpha-1 (1355) ;mRNA; r:40990-45224